MGNQGAKPDAEFGDRLAVSFGGAPFEDCGPSAVPEVEPALLGQETVTLSDGIEVEVQVVGYLTYRRQGIARLKLAGKELAAEPVGDLPIGGDRGTSVERILHESILTVCCMHTLDKIKLKSRLCIFNNLARNCSQAIENARTYTYPILPQ